jgi:hypothetical protein
MLTIKQPKKIDSNLAHLPDGAILEFKDLFRKRYHVELSDEEASFRANNLVNLYAAVYGRNQGRTETNLVSDIGLGRKEESCPRPGSISATGHDHEAKRRDISS